MIRETLKFGLLLLLAVPLIVTSCVDDEDMQPMPDPDPMPDTTMVIVDTTQTDTVVMVEINIANLLINQVEEVVIPTSEEYQLKMSAFLSVAEAFIGGPDGTTLTSVRNAYLEANLAYQAMAVHNYYATENIDLVNTTNLYPVSVSLLDGFIENESYNFNTTAQQRANGFPALDYLLYGSDDVVSAFSNQPKRGAFFLALVSAMKDKADSLLERWAGSLKENFIENGGTELGSSVSVQLNQSMLYYEVHVRGNKVGIPIGRLGPNDTPFDPDVTKIEGYYQSLQVSDEAMSLNFLKAAIEEMEDIYLGTTATGEDGIGYEDLLLNIEQDEVDIDIKAQYLEIYDQIAARTNISGDENLYNSIQHLITLYKSDLFPLLNVQDADGSNDGD